MLHREILRDVRAHAVTEQDQRQTGILCANPVVDEQAVIDQLLPATGFREIPEVFRVWAMAAVIVCYNREAVRIGAPREPLITAMVFAQAVKDLHHTSRRLIGGPMGAANDVPVGRRNLDHARYTARHD